MHRLYQRWFGKFLVFGMVFVSLFFVHSKGVYAQSIDFSPSTIACANNSVNFAASGLTPTESYYVVLECSSLGTGCFTGETRYYSVAPGSTFHNINRTFGIDGECGGNFDVGNGIWTVRLGSKDPSFVTCNQNNILNCARVSCPPDGTPNCALDQKELTVNNVNAPSLDCDIAITTPPSDWIPGATIDFEITNASDGVNFSLIMTNPNGVGFTITPGITNANASTTYSRSVGAPETADEGPYTVDCRDSTTNALGGSINFTIATGGVTVPPVVPPPPPGGPVNASWNQIPGIDPSSFGSIEETLAAARTLLIPVGIVIGLFLITSCGYKVMTSQGDPYKLKDAKECLTSAIIGLLFVLLSVSIIRLIISSVLVPI